MIDEVAIDLGHGVSGVLTQPGESSGRPLMVLLNAGFIHRIGPFRLHVDLARALARLGVASVRLDQPGVGDAPVKRDPDDAAVVSRALDRLALLTGSNEFIVGGLCSAADQAWRMALTDGRVRGVLLLDPVARRNFWFRVGQLNILRNRGRMAWQAIRRRMKRQHVVSQAGDSRDWSLLDPDEPLAPLLARGVDVFALYTGGAAGYFTHRAQFAAGFGKSATHPLIHFEHWPECDHMFMRSEERTRLIRAICAWCSTAFAGRDTVPR